MNILEILLREGQSGEEALVQGLITGLIFSVVFGIISAVGKLKRKNKKDWDEVKKDDSKNSNDDWN
ncbi:MAG: hypothetical protein II766_03700 [Paludibacteraceae bacterium]|nr:hypothetical protein [Paludibacteraceae bacterium]